MNEIEQKLQNENELQIEKEQDSIDAPNQQGGDNNDSLDNVNEHNNKDNNDESYQL